MTKIIKKMLINIVILIVSIIWYSGIPGYFGGFREELLIIIKGFAGFILFSQGLINAWIAYDDYRSGK